MQRCNPFNKLLLCKPYVRIGEGKERHSSYPRARNLLQPFRKSPELIYQSSKLVSDRILKPTFHKSWYRAIREVLSLKRLTSVSGNCNQYAPFASGALPLLPSRPRHNWGSCAIRLAGMYVVRLALCENVETFHLTMCVALSFLKLFRNPVCRDGVTIRVSSCWMFHLLQARLVKRISCRRRHKAFLPMFWVIKRIIWQRGGWPTAGLLTKTFGCQIEEEEPTSKLNNTAKKHAQILAWEGLRSLSRRLQLNLRRQRLEEKGKSTRREDLPSVLSWAFYKHG